jgi:hypothetical protein
MSSRSPLQAQGGQAGSTTDKKQEYDQLPEMSIQENPSFIPAKD